MTTLGGKRVLVTGSSGFIGSRLLRRLSRVAGEIVALDRSAPGRPGHAVPDASVSWVTADVSRDDLAPHVDACDVVFHLAAVPGVRASWGAEFPTYLQANVIGTHRLLEACLSSGTRTIVYASSSSVYGVVRGPSSETDPTAPVSPYGISKLAAENLCRAYAERADSAFGAVALRYFTVYGPGLRPDMLIGRLIHSAMTGEPVHLYGDGSQRREFTYVDDVVSATIAAAELDREGSDVINVAGGSSTSVLDMLDLVGEVVGSKPNVRRVPFQNGDVPTTGARSHKARRLLGHRPEVDLREGLARTFEWMTTLPPEALSRYATKPPA